MPVATKSASNFDEASVISCCAREMRARNSSFEMGFTRGPSGFSDENAAGSAGRASWSGLAITGVRLAADPNAAVCKNPRRPDLSSKNETFFSWPQESELETKSCQEDWQTQVEQSSTFRRVFALIWPQLRTPKDVLQKTVSGYAVMEVDAGGTVHT